MEKSEFINSLKKQKPEGLSIIITAYKAQEFIEECLDSIQNQNYFKYNDNYEILLGIDACESTLNKVNEIRSKYKNLKVFYATENGGTYRMRNSLWIRAKYENLLFFDSDDVMPKEFIGNIMKEHSKYDVIRYRLKMFKDGQNKNENVRITSWCSHGSIFIKKQIMQRVGGYSDERISMDMELNRRLTGLRYNILQSQTIFYWYRESDNQLTKAKTTSMKSLKRKEVNDKINRRIKNKDFINKSIVENISVSEI